MVDCFDVLGLPKRAALNEDQLHQAYAARSRTVHPDHGGNETDAAQANAAYETLRVPERRLKHLLETAGPEEAKAWRTVPLDDGMMSLFSQLGKALENSAQFLDRKARARTALARALLTNEEMVQREALEGLGFEIEQRRNMMEAQLPDLDASLASGDSPMWQQLAVMQARFAYLGRWQNQVRERLLALM